MEADYLVMKADYFREKFDMPHFQKNTTDLYSLGYKLCYRDFAVTASRCFDMFKEAGLSEVECIPIPADGTSTAMDYVLPQAWDVEEATLDVVGPESVRMRIADFSIERFCVANRCPPTPPEGITAGLVLWDDVKAGAYAEGKIVLCMSEDPMCVDHEMIKRGAVAIVSGYSEAGDELQDATFWINGWGFPYWYHTKEDKMVPCFSIPHAKAVKLAELLKLHGSLELKAYVKSRVYDGELYTITGVVPGSEPGELTLIAHIYEPFINDNYSGAAALAEMAGILVKGIRSGDIPPLKKSVRFILSMEQYGIAHYFQDRAKRERTLLAINMDGISFDTKKTRQRIHVYTSPHFLPSCTDMLLRSLAEHELREYPINIITGNLGDDTFISDRTIGIPTHYLISMPGAYHHSSADSSDVATDWRTAEDLACIAASLIASFAAADHEALAGMLSHSVRLAGDEICREAARISEAVKRDEIPAGKALEYFLVFCGRQEERLKAFTRYDKTLDIDSAVRDLKKIAGRETAGFAEKFPPVERSLNRNERYAANMLVTRLGTGLPTSLARVPAVERFEHATYRETILNWLDGETDLLAAMQRNAAATGIAYPTAKEIGRFVHYVHQLEKYGYVSVRYRKSFTKEDIVKSLRALGLQAGDKVIVHSSLSSMGHVEGGPETVCRALMDVVTYEGLLMMPAFNAFNAFKPGGAGYYDPLETPAGTGAITEYFRKMPGVLRSLDVSNSFAAWGRDARVFIKDHHLVPTMYYGSPLHKLEEAGGKVILIDCPNSFTFAHVVETTNEAPCLSKRTEEYPVRLPDGRMVKCRTWSWRNGSCPLFETGSVPGSELPDFLELEADKLYPPTVRIYGMLEQANLLKYGHIGDAPAYSFKLGDWRRFHEPMLRDGVPGISGCSGCPIRPRVVRESVESDWDAENMRVRPDTTAFTGEIYW